MIHQSKLSIRSFAFPVAAGFTPALVGAYCIRPGWRDALRRVRCVSLSSCKSFIEERVFPKGRQRVKRGEIFPSPAVCSRDLYGRPIFFSVLLIITILSRISCTFRFHSRPRAISTPCGRSKPRVRVANRDGSVETVSRLNLFLPAPLEVGLL